MARRASPASDTSALPAEQPPERHVEQIVADIGPRLKELRSELGLSLQQMSAIAEVSAASIHKIERGDMVPTITTLLKLASAFRRPLSELIDERPVDTNAVWHTPNGAGQPSSFGQGGEALQISGPATRFKAFAQAVQLPAGASGGLPQQRAGEALLFVLAGTVDVTVESQHFALRKHDALHVLTDRMVRWANAGRGTTSMLWVNLTHQ
jgi:transcriptional regulator with XRE-family HTH domain